MGGGSSSRHCSSARKLLKFQAFVLFSFVLVMLVSQKWGIALVIGGGIGFLANALFYLQVFRYRGAQQVNRILKGFYRGGALKFLVVIISFTWAFKYLNLASPEVVVIGFLVVQSTYWLVPLLFDKQGKEGN